MPADTTLSPVARLVRRHDREHFLTALFAPSSGREGLFALYAFNYELAKVREVVSEPMLGRIRLQWWRESIAAICAGGGVRRHEVVEPLGDAIRARQLPRDRFERMIDARELDLDDAPVATLAALEGYAADTAGELGCLAAEVLGVRDPAATAAARRIGIAYGLAGLLRAVPFHARRKRLYLPGDLIADSGLRVQHDLFELKSTPALARTVEPVADAARRHLAAARELRRQVPRAALPALLPAIIAERWLDVLRAAGHDPLDRRVAMPDARASWRLAWAALRRRY